MKAAVIVFPASNCDRDVAMALERATGKAPLMAWHGEANLPDQLDLIVLPGGFSYGDYLRCGAMAAHSPIMREVIARAKKGTPVLGICNGFQILCETGLLPGVLMRNASLKFVSRSVAMTVEAANTMFTARYTPGQTIRIPVAHGDGNYFADKATLDRLEGEGQVAFRYAQGDNPNGAARNIAGIFNERRTIMGMMPHPERVSEPLHGGTDGKAIFDSLVGALS
ncbi:MAG: phosphoribosylformylglycinamidine synthase subunit PurQ [Alphaproteobacteria bacterium]|nr:phosphoribosylformylglycinamidine synthase subunit PurQ [Alphaproteobacteria bacterium]